MHDGWTDVVATLLGYQSPVGLIFGRHLFDTSLFQRIVDIGRNRARLPFHRERSQRRLRVFRRQRRNRPQSRGYCLGNRSCMSRCPDTRAIDAPPPTIRQYAVNHQVDIVLPVINLVLTNQNFAESWPMNLYPRIRGVLLNRGGSAEDQAACGVVQHRSTDLAQAGIERNRLTRDARLKERLRHPPRSPRLLRARLEHQPNLQRNDR